MSGATLFKKAKLTMDKDKALEIALGLCEEQVPEIITVQQEDVFFKTGNSKTRLKLRREIGHDLTEVCKLIASSYGCSGKVGKKDVHLETKVQDADVMEELLEKSLGSMARIVKTRRLIGIQRFGLHCEIHLDCLEGLGEFIEFEIAAGDDTKGSDKAEELMKDLEKSFGIRDQDYIDTGVAYVDLVLLKQN